MEKNRIIQTVADNIKSILVDRNIAAVDLARKCKISSTTLSKIINGNMGISVPMVVILAEGLGVEVNDILKGVVKSRKKEEGVKESQNKLSISIGMLSINNSRITCIKDSLGKVIGTSELEGGLDLTDTSSKLIELIQQAIYAALPKAGHSYKLEDAKLNLATQSYEFEKTRAKFTFYARRYFGDVFLLSDWQITYFAAFAGKHGMSLIVDKGVSLAYKNNGHLKKLGGWKFPVYDLGGENWLGLETIRHTIEAAEGYVPMSKLARSALSKFNGKIEAITEACFKGDISPDIYCSFADFLLRSYLAKDSVAKEIVERGFKLIYKAIEKVDSVSKNELKIALSGSLADVYKPFFEKKRLIEPCREAKKVNLLADITKEYLIEHGIEDA